MIKDGKGEMGERKEHSSLHLISPFSYDHTLFFFLFRNTALKFYLYLLLLPVYSTSLFS